jgi:hypothetical protein
MFGQKSDEKTIPCMKDGPLCVFYFQNVHVFSCFSGSHYNFEIFFTVNGYLALKQLHKIQLT